MIERAIPSSGERIPVIGLGTWQTFDVTPSSGRDAQLADVLSKFAASGGRVVDTSPMYGRAEETIGRLRDTADATGGWFMATKIWTRGEREGERQVDQSLRLMRAKQLDLVQVHNLVDYQAHLQTLRRLKGEGIVRYVGITHYQVGAFDELERIMARDAIDFVQLPYSARVRDAEKRLLPLAQDRGIAVVVNRPFEEGALLRRNESDVPEWAREAGIQSRAEMLLRFIVSHPAVTVVIPATSNPRHVVANLIAGDAVIDDATRERIAAEVRN
jgi:diketogulonate reductase-like aldo/keto reductase